MTKRDNDRELKHKYKVQAHKILGGNCAVCGFYNPDCMIIDHILPINGVRKYGGGTDIHRALIHGRVDATEFSNLQLLCCNCSAIKTLADKRSGLQNHRYSKGANNA